MSSVTWPQADARHVWHPYTQMRDAPPPVPLAKAEGAWLYDVRGRAILDGISSWWVTLHGHNVPELNAALADQASKMAHVMFAGFTHEPGARLAAVLAERTGLPKVFFSDNGSTAVEVALKMAYQSWHNLGDAQRTTFIAFEHAYHGDTFGAMAASGTSLFHGAFAPLLFRVLRAHGPVCPDAADGGPCTATCPQSLAALLERHGRQVAAVLVEPMIQGAGGMRIWPAAALRNVAQIARSAEVPLIYDEVFTGFGRTGRLFAGEHAGIRPDIVCLSKALTAGYLPLGATLASQRIYDAFISHDRRRTLFHGHSFTGNPLACAVGLASLDLFDTRQGLRRVAALESHYSRRLARLNSHPRVACTRHLGALAVIEVASPGNLGYLHTVGPQLTEAFLQAGVLLRPMGHVLYFLPPLCIREAEVDDVFDIIETVLTRLP